MSPRGVGATEQYFLVEGGILGGGKGGGTITFEDLAQNITSLKDQQFA